MGVAGICVVTVFSRKRIDGAGGEAGLGARFAGFFCWVWQVETFAKGEGATVADHQPCFVVNEHPNRRGPSTARFDRP